MDRAAEPSGVALQPRRPLAQSRLAQHSRDLAPHPPLTIPATACPSPVAPGTLHLSTCRPFARPRSHRRTTMRRATATNLWWTCSSRWTSCRSVSWRWCLCARAANCVNNEWSSLGVHRRTVPPLLPSGSRASLPSRPRGRPPEDTLGDAREPLTLPLPPSPAPPAAVPCARAAGDGGVALAAAAAAGGAPGQPRGLGDGLRAALPRGGGGAAAAGEGQAVLCVNAAASGQWRLSLRARRAVRWGPDVLLGLSEPPLPPPYPPSLPASWRSSTRRPPSPSMRTMQWR
jgi:hypothetical protein